MPRAPLLVVVRDSLPVVLLTAGATISVGVTFYGTTVVGLSYGVSELGKSESEMLLVVVIGMAFTAALVPLFGRLSDRVGRKPIFVAGQVGLVLLAFPWILLSDSPSFAMTLAGYLLIFIPYSATWATMGALLAEVFDTRVRYSGLSLGYTLGNIAGAAFAPIIAANLLEFTGDITAVGRYMVVAAVISTLAALRLQPNVRGPEQDVGQPEMSSRSGTPGPSTGSSAPMPANARTVVCPGPSGLRHTRRVVRLREIGSPSAAGLMLRPTTSVDSRSSGRNLRASVRGRSETVGQAGGNVGPDRHVLKNSDAADSVTPPNDRQLRCCTVFVSASTASTISKGTIRVSSPT